MLGQILFAPFQLCYWLAVAAVAVCEHCHHWAKRTFVSRPCSISLVGRHVLVTGAAGGLGQSVVRCLLARGAIVIATDLDEKRLNELWAAEQDVLTVACDVGKEKSIAALKAFLAIAGVDHVWGIVNAAGILDMVRHPSFAAEVAHDRAELQTRINFLGPQMLARAFLPELLAHQGRVVNVCSSSGRVPFAGVGLYGSTKAALRMLTFACDTELRHTGVRFIAVSPGGIQTPMVDAFSSMEPKESETRFAKQINEYYECLDRPKVESQPAARVAKVIVEEALTAGFPLDEYLIDYSPLALMWRFCSHAEPGTGPLLFKKGMGVKSI